MTQLGFYFDQARCTGCQACVVACKDWNDVAAASVAWLSILALEEGRFPYVSLAYYPLSCFHCANPACVPACPTGAITKAPRDGLVSIDRERCLPGCSLCRRACPYRAPQVGVVRGARAEMCTFCPDRLARGQKPACVAACPVRALDAGPLPDLFLKYGSNRQAAGLPDPQLTLPSLIVRRRDREGQER